MGGNKVIGESLRRIQPRINNHFAVRLFEQLSGVVHHFHFRRDVLKVLRKHENVFRQGLLRKVERHLGFVRIEPRMRPELQTM